MSWCPGVLVYKLFKIKPPLNTLSLPVKPDFKKFLFFLSFLFVFFNLYLIFAYRLI